ncbi:hypothetical protein AYK26_04845 [Euryarchaeota archaeon SM23-78]|nr:MAG: hypothetical protein AYK26_04845 [Euryarchaeota archaeon SM23-78]MBW3000766.1 hypothetical protein [Candidatus Woesearchaeota archaeon]
MLETDVKTLETAGLTHAQSIIYLTLLELGQTKIGHIIEKTRLQSSVVHNNINKLIDKGLVNFVMVGKIKHYQVAEPEVFLNYMEEQKQRIDENKREIQKIIPKLNLIKEESKKKTEVEVYKGKKGFKTAFIEEYSKAEPKHTVCFLAMPSEYQADQDIQDVFAKVNKIILEKKGKFKGLGPRKVKKLWEGIYTKKKGYELLYLDEDFPWDINILSETVLISLWGDEPTVIKVKNKTFRDHAMRYFNYKWRQAKP